MFVYGREKLVYTENSPGIIVIVIFVVEVISQEVKRKWEESSAAST